MWINDLLANRAKSTPGQNGGGWAAAKETPNSQIKANEICIFFF